MKFALLLPTRKRPDNLKRLFTSIENTISGNNTVEMVMWVDDDDNSTLNYLEQLDESSFSFDINCFIKKRNGHIGKMFNFLWEHSDADIYQMINDDLVYDTDNWDEKIVHEVNKFDDHIVFLWGSNLDTNFPNHFFTTKEVTNVLGYFCWRATPGHHAERWIYEIFKHLKNKFNKNRMTFRDDIKLPHLSPLHSDTEPDKIYKEYRERGKDWNDDKKFNKPKNRKERIYKAKQLKEYIIQNGGDY